MKNIVLVDSSYTSFHRFFATLRWFSLAKKDIYKEHKDNNKYDWSKNEIFIEKYKKMYLESIVKLLGKKIYNNSIIVFCQDAKQSSLWRNSLMDDYKGNRPDLSLKANMKPTFKYTYETLIPGLVKKNDHIFTIKKNHMEADDIIALCCRYIRAKHKTRDIYLVSGDQDFYQLGYNNLYFADYKKKELLQFSSKEARRELLLKIINGDCSDNIPSIFPKNKKEVSNKQRKEIRESKKSLKQYLDTNKNAKIQFELNTKMIDFKYIPKKFLRSIYKKIHLILK